MPSDRVSRNDPCPCGSGRKYKHCCGRAGGPGTGRPNTAPAGQPDDFLFPDGSPERATELAVEAMRGVGIDPALIHAFEVTGLLVGEDNRHLISPDALAEWDRAVEEYRRQESENYPLATMARYGPDDRTATKVVAAVFAHDGAEPVLERWVGTDVDTSPKVRAEVAAFLNAHGAKKVVAVPEILGCPHEEGEDFPMGEDCPFCPFWKGKQGTARRDDLF
jgi:hypothetical protein